MFPIYKIDHDILTTKGSTQGEKTRRRSGFHVSSALFYLMISVSVFQLRVFFKRGTLVVSPTVKPRKENIPRNIVIFGLLSEYLRFEYGTALYLLSQL